MNLLDLIPNLRRAAGTNGGEYHGPCLFCGGHDRLRAWPEPANGDAPNWTCRQCGKGGDVINYVRYRDGVGYQEALRILGVSQPEPRDIANTVPAPQPTAPPCDAWQARMRRFVGWAQEQLWTDTGTYQGGSPLDYLRRRGLTDATIRSANIGYNPTKFYRRCRDFGLDDDAQFVLPIGIILPNEIDGALWGVAVRQSDGQKREIRGSVKALYGADTIQGNKPVMILEGAVDALAVQQQAGDVCAAVASGGTKAAQKTHWLLQISRASHILVALDADGPGQEAASFWISAFPEQARLWRPLWGDPAQMLQDGADLRSWVVAGVEGHALTMQPRPRAEMLDAITEWLLHLAQLTGGIQPEHTHIPDDMTDADLSLFLERIQERCSLLCRDTEALRCAREDANVAGAALSRAARVIIERNRVTRRDVYNEMRSSGYQSLEGY
jgi:phage/plasmid primase-like uncharacterized protein